MYRICSMVATLILLFSQLLPSSLAAQPKLSRPKPAQQRQGPTIPDVPRDQVICFALYTTHKNVLKLTAQLYPLREGEERRVKLEISEHGAEWRQVADADVNPEGWMAVFRVENWDDTRTRQYRVTHAGGSRYEGLIRRNPRDKDEIVVGLFTGNGNNDRGPRQDIVRNIKVQDPDLLFFSGDQSYDHKEHTAAWLLFGRQFGEIIRDRPTITIPDDHDVGQGNLWGEAGGIAKVPGADDGGYVMPPSYVNMVQRAQTSHLPDPYDPAPVRNGISVYYTALNVGGIDFAILEDRKWKTGPNGVVPQMGPRPDHIADPDYDRASVDVPEAELLGKRQLQFLREWGQNWDRAQMKVVLSQTIFAGGAHLHGQITNRLVADMDSNGWPQSGRAAALREIRRCFAFMMGGDQHLATAIHHGINDWEDSGWSFCCPSIWNYYGRWWWPLEAPLNHSHENPLEFTGRYRDGFGNKITMHAYANPAEGNNRAAGYGLVRFKKATRSITMECWPRFVDVTQPGARQYAGWPITIQQEDNYPRKAMAWLPALEIKGASDAVVRVTDEDSGEVVYVLRIKGQSFRPKVFKAGTYRIEIGEGAQRKIFEHVPSGPAQQAEAIQLDLASGDAAPTTRTINLRALVRTVADAVLRDFPEPPPFNWGEGVLVLGMMRAHQFTGDKRYLEFVQRFAQHWQERGIGELLVAKGYCGHWGPAWAMLLLHEQTRDPAALDLARQVTDFIMGKAERTHDAGLSHFFGKPQLWVDTLAMACPVLVHADRFQPRPALREEAIRQLEIFSERLQDPKTGLYYHMWDDATRTRTSPLWARGNGWVALSFNEVLKHTKPGAPERKRLLPLYEKMVDGILATQDPESGLWHTVLDAPDTYLESSSSAMFIAAVAESHSAGVLKQENLQPLRRAWLALTKQVDEHGRVINVSAGTRPSTKQQYAAIPLGTFTWGTGAYLLAGCAWGELE